MEMDLDGSAGGIPVSLVRGDATTEPEPEPERPLSLLLRFDQRGPTWRPLLALLSLSPSSNSASRRN